MNISLDQLKNIGKKAGRAVVCALAAAALAISSLADTPDELFSGTSQPGQSVVARADTINDAETEKKPSFRERLRRFFLRQPSVVRGLLMLPFWAVGKALLGLLSLLFTALSPVWQILLGVLLNAALLFGLFALVYKLLFPNKRLRDFFTKRNILLLAAGSLLLSVADTILRAYWEDYRPVSVAIKLAAGLLVLSLLAWRIFGKRKKKRTIQPA